MTFDILPEAEDEAFDAAVYLERARRGSGRAFRLAYRTALADIEATPDRFPLADDAPENREIRYVYLTRFHYRVLYFVDGETVLVVAVAHTSRRPGYWAGRLP